MMPYPAYKVAAAHVAPVFLDTDRSVAKACAVIEEAAGHGARLIAFPEVFLPGFPVWAGIEAPIRTHELFKKLAASAVRIDGPELARVSQTARRTGTFVSIGFTEGTTTSVGCLWNSNALFGADGTLLNHHRKLVPTYYEKLIWANGDGNGLRVSATELGRLGMLICGENTNPLARFALLAEGEQVHISSYPPVWPTRPPRRPRQLRSGTRHPHPGRRARVRRQGLQHRGRIVRRCHATANHRANTRPGSTANSRAVSPRHLGGIRPGRQTDR
jgi:predicted amidohydrolase